MMGKLAILVLGLGTAAWLWRMFSPGAGRWPPQRLTVWSAAEIWGGASIVFVSAYSLGALDAGRMPLADGVRYGVGLPLVMAGNAAVSLGILQLGWIRTSGGDGVLETRGLYALSRHPQYLGHATALTGWVLFTGGLWGLPVTVAAFVCLGRAIVAEDIWLERHHGSVHRAYKTGVRCLI